MTKKLIFAVAAVLVVLSLMVAPAQAQAPDQLRINSAIANGLSFLATQQQANGSWCDPYLATQDCIATTGLVLMIFQENALRTGWLPSNPNYQYEPQVSAGLTYLFNNIDGTIVSAGFFGVYPTYDTSIGIMAIALSVAPNHVIPVGLFEGYTYKSVLQGMINWLQANRNPADGGWSYYAYGYNGYIEPSDQSNTSYAALALEYAHSPQYNFNLDISSSVIAGLATWSANDQDLVPGVDWGGAFYDNLQSLPGANIYRTGGLLHELALVGETATSPRVQDAVSFIQNVWGNIAGEGSGGGWIGNYQAMFSLMKGMESLNIQQITVGGSQIYWYDPVATYILNNEIVVDATTKCYWSSIYEEPVGTPILSTAWALETLEYGMLPLFQVNSAPALVSTTASGLAYSRVSKTYIGTVTITNIWRYTINGPFYIVFTSLTDGVTLANASGTYYGSPYVTVNTTSLAAGQSATVSVQFSDPANAKINFTPVIYVAGQI
jgi:hypothetical protein